MYHQFLLWPERHAETVASLWTTTASDSLFLPWDFIAQHVLAFSSSVVVCLTLLYILIFNNFDVLFHNTILTSFTRAQKRKFCYQMINLLANLCLGSAGLYWEWRSYQLSMDITGSIHYLTVKETTLGFDNAVYFSAGQIGYQLWAVPMGIFYMKEPLSMIVHHFTVIVCASMSGFLFAGFRYWTPFFYGLVELSSVPLAIMNAFKDHPATLQQSYPNVYKCVRIIFAATFLYIRIVMFVPRKYLFLRDQLLLWTSIRQRYSEDSAAPYLTVLLYQCFMASVWLSAFFLLVLQTYWATLIVKGVASSRRKKNTTKMNNGITNGMSSGSTASSISSMEPESSTTSTETNPKKEL
jgi:hypothetical protein